MPVYKDSGFDNIEDYLDHLDDLWRERNGLPPLFPEGLKRVRPRDGLGTRQVGLRLPEADFQALCELGVEYGLSPATLARMIVVRVVRSRRLK